MAKSKISSLFSKSIKYLIRHEWLVLLLFVVFLLRMPSLFEPHWYGDEEIYLVMGQGLRKGLVFYRDIFDHKPPLIYVLAALVRNVFWFRLTLLFVHGLSVVYFARLAKLFFKNHWVVITSTSVYAVLSTIPMLEGNMANGENFMTVPALMAMYLLYRYVKANKNDKKVKDFLWIGILFSIAFLIKVPIIFDFFAAGFFYIFLSDKKMSWKEVMGRAFSKPLLLTLIGFFGLIIVSVIYYFYAGAGEPYLRSALLQNIGYVKSWRGEGEVASPLTNPLVWRMLVIAGMSGMYLALKYYKLVTREFLLIGLWLLLATYGALLSNRPYPHYLLQPLIPAVYMLGLVMERVWQKSIKDLGLSLLTAGIVTVFLVEVGFWHYPSLPYYENFIAFATGKKDKDAHDNYFPSALNRNRKVASYLRSRTSPNEKVFVWGEEPAIYDLADRLPVGRYIVSFHIRDFPDGYDDTYYALTEYMPMYIVWLPHQTPSFPRLEALIQSNYVLVETVDDAYIYKKLGSALVVGDL